MALYASRFSWDNNIFKRGALSNIHNNYPEVAAMSSH